MLGTTRYAAAGLFLCLAVAALLAGCHGRKHLSPAPPPPDLPVNEEAAAGMRGAEWLLGHKDVIPPHLAVVAFRKLYKVTPDEDLAAELFAAARELERDLPAPPTLDILQKPAMTWNDVRQIMIEILQRKCAGWEFETDALALEKIVQHQWTTLFPGGTSESKKVVAAYFMSELGIGGVRFYDMVVHDVRSAWPPQGGFRSYPYIFGLYGLTHIVLTGSGYYDRYLEPAGFETEIAAFRSALNEFTAVKKLTATEIDVISEILVCLKLLGVETGPEYSLMRQRIAGYQNPDGSWGSGKATDSATIHTTSVATLALMDFAPAFRSGNVFCDTSTYR